MPLLKICKYPDPVLKKMAEPVEDINEEIKMILRDMAETMYANAGVGLAAPQVGRSLRLIVLDTQQPDEESGLLKLINPRITEKQGKKKGEEGCLSCPGLVTEVGRFETVTVTARLPDGSDTEIAAEGILSTALQHEIDHLDGILLVDRLSSLRRGLYYKRRIKENEK